MTAFQTGQINLGGPVGAIGSSSGINLGNIDTIQIGDSEELNRPQPNINIGITRVHGGFIVGVKDKSNYHSQPEYHIITDKKNFDRELGKIISFHLLKRT